MCEQDKRPFPQKDGLDTVYLSQQGGKRLLDVDLVKSVIGECMLEASQAELSSEHRQKKSEGGAAERCVINRVSQRNSFGCVCRNNMI